MTLPLFTIVLDFDGGTYVSQVCANDEQHAVKEWAALLQRMRSIGAASERLARSVTFDTTLTPVDGLSGVWCWTGIVDDKLALANLVRSA